ncbi:MAG TPA: hypothetical protein PLH75_04665 [Amaricoccus sp.]|uniref:hypothetical protein n=1 Tax=Amaricoccus sp. TaxID=1872485 RepID=UPI001E066443|nr:hypothetical protein [Amaricoccus sp.]MCB1374271.1 hypothetical protein [Paracoccaceae bacterium]MCC0066354.1 hypothetical protein [Rhodovulum sp.]MCB1402990.1 hypothetical protein [Paracoccaceae bacterium]HPG22061.1 hypothetical protein [Amaricoccus sp.]HRW14703.1 hypothetical protein [Amaricoccus sp.]
MMTQIRSLCHAPGVVAALTLVAAAADAHELAAEAGNAERAAFDIVAADIATDGRHAIFTMSVAGTPGADRPEAAGGLAGAPVFSYVWPTTLDPSVVGFEAGAGILAFAVTIHPDFDDTPLFDESGSGTTGDDGGSWHSHWVVLGPDEACGPGALKVIDIPEGVTPPLPLTWPGLPILIDSPGWSPVFDGPQLSVTVPFADIGAVEAARFDGVAAALRVDANIHAPLLCVTDVFDVASGDLSLPGRVGQ